MSSIFPPAQKGGVPPGPNVCNGFNPNHPVLGEGPLYVAADCTTVLTDCQLNSIASEILAAVDALDFSYNADRINNLGDALAAKFQAIQAAIDLKISRSGDGMTGPLEVICPPANDNDAACKRYVDDVLVACCDDVRQHVDDAIDGFQGQLDGKVNRAGDYMLGPLYLSGDPTMPNEAVTKNYVDTLDIPDISNRVLRTGDTMTGSLILAGNPTLPMEAATKQYVDMFGGLGVIIAPDDDPPLGIFPPGRLWWNSSNGRLYIRYIDPDYESPPYWVAVTDGLEGGVGGGISGNYLPISGGTLSGALFLNANPTQPLQAATKHYVDSQIALGGTFIDAPADGEIYARQNNDWVPITVSMDGGSY